MSSSNSVNYAIRPSKQVERKIIFETLLGMSDQLRFEDYQYVGFGGVWFVDFAMAHRLLGLRSMLSIENDAATAKRAKFNRPYGCVDVRHGDSQKILPTLEYDKRRVLAWLDYDTGLGGPVLDDVATLCRHVKNESVLIVTVNADPLGLPVPDEAPCGRCGGRSDTYEQLATRIRRAASELVPNCIPEKATTMAGYPKFLASILFRQMRQQLRSAGRRGDTLVPMFNVAYRDTSPMVTVGGVVVAADCAQGMTELLRNTRTAEFVREEPQLRIRVPPLTVRERLSLDQAMPRTVSLGQEGVEEMGFRLKAQHIEAYERFYRYHPTFGEVVI